MTLASTSDGRLHATVTVCDIQHAAVESDLFDWMVKHGHTYAEEVTVCRVDRTPRTRVTSKLEDHAISLNRSADIRYIMKVSMICRTILHRGNVDEAIFPEVWMKCNRTKSPVSTAVEIKSAAGGRVNSSSNIHPLRDFS